MRPPARRHRTVHRRGDRAGDPRRADLPRLHQGDPVPLATTRSRRRSRRPTTSSPTRPCASPASRSARSPSVEPIDERRRGRAGDDAHRRHGPADPQGRDGDDPPAHLPRGQLLRRPPARHAAAPELDDGDTIPIHQTAHAGPARPDAHRAAVRHARGPADAAAASTPSALEGEGAEGFSRSIQYWSRPTATRRSSPTRRSARAEHDLSRLHRERRDGGRGAGPQPAARSRR